jgi:hypothetical protein
MSKSGHCKERQKCEIISFGDYMSEFTIDNSTIPAEMFKLCKYKEWDSNTDDNWFGDSNNIVDENNNNSQNEVFNGEHRTNKQDSNDEILNY